jgi:type I site-specific restriction endonuclease
LPIYKLQTDKNVSQIKPASFANERELQRLFEAKKTSIDPRLAQAQTEFYVTQLEQRQSFRPFGFMTNGYDIYFYDVGFQNKREVRGFFSRLDLETHLHIRRVAKAFDDGKRRALLTMATGTVEPGRSWKGDQQ